MNIKEEAKKYAQDRIISLLEQAVADAYVKGYNAACEELNNEKGKIVEVDGLKFIDMDLPSGTLWCTELYGESYLSKGHLMNFQEAVKYSLPTWDQCLELFRECKVTNNKKNDGIVILSKSSKKISLRSISGVYPYDFQDRFISFWLNAQSSSAYCAMTEDLDKKKDGAIIHVSRKWKFEGDKLPILLVKTK